MKRSNEKGTAMLFAIILVLVLSVMAASMMFLSQSETWSSMNYRLMTQARYGAEAGIHATANFLLNNYAPPAPVLGLPPGVIPPPPAGYNMLSPVPAGCGGSPCMTDGGGNPIVLSSLRGTAANYPDGAQQAAFNALLAAPNNTLQAGGTTINYTSSRRRSPLRRLQQITAAPRWISPATAQRTAMTPQP